MNYKKMTKLQLWIEVCKRGLVGNDCTWYPNRWTKAELIELLENVSRETLKGGFSVN